MGGPTYCLADLMLFPHLSRLYYLQGSVLQETYETLGLEQKYPKLTNLYKTIREMREFGATQSDSMQIVPASGSTEIFHSLGALIPKAYFHLWLEELIQGKIGSKPPLRFPFIYKRENGQKYIAKM